eukprot:6197454-Pleurochrysis_carterae.AAC.2
MRTAVLEKSNAYTNSFGCALSKGNAVLPTPHPASRSTSRPVAPSPRLANSDSISSNRTRSPNSDSPAFSDASRPVVVSAACPLAGVGASDGFSSLHSA